MSELDQSTLVAVSDLMRDAGETVQDNLTSRILAGGRSNLTYEISDGHSRWVLRRPPLAGGTPSAHDVAREFRVTKALGQAGVPVSRAVLLETDSPLLGAPFTISAFVDGTTLRDRTDIEVLSPNEVTSVVQHLVEALARLHDVDHIKAGLESYGRPDGYAARQLRRWSGQWDIVGASHHGLAAELVGKLNLRIPGQSRVSVVHGDYRSDNTIIDMSNGGTVSAIVDWELSTIGDPVADVAMMCAYRSAGLDLVLGFECAWSSDRLPEQTDLADLYERISGHTLEYWNFHLALANYKLAVIAAGIDHRYSSGGTVGSGFAQAGEAVDGYLARGLRALAGE